MSVVLGSAYRQNIAAALIFVGSMGNTNRVLFQFECFDWLSFYYWVQPVSPHYMKERKKHYKKIVEKTKNIFVYILQFLHHDRLSRTAENLLYILNLIKKDKFIW